jgi:hypothetical protein
VCKVYIIYYDRPLVVDVGLATPADILRVQRSNSVDWFVLSLRTRSTGPRPAVKLSHSLVINSSDDTDGVNQPARFLGFSCLLRIYFSLILISLVLNWALCNDSRVQNQMNVQKPKMVGGHGRGAHIPRNARKKCSQCHKEKSAPMFSTRQFTSRNPRCRYCGDINRARDGTAHPNKTKYPNKCELHGRHHRCNPSWSLSSITYTADCVYEIKSWAQFSKRLIRCFAVCGKLSIESDDGWDS